MNSLSKEIATKIKPKIHNPSKIKELFQISLTNIVCKKNGIYSEDQSSKDHWFTLYDINGVKGSVNINENNMPKNIPFKG